MGWCCSAKTQGTNGSSCKACEAYLHREDSDLEDDRQKVKGQHVKAGPQGC